MATTAMLRPQTAMGYSSPYQDCNPDVKLGEEVLLPGFQKHLHDFYLKATPEDRLKCAELLTSLEQGDNIRERAKNLGLQEPGRATFKQRSRTLPSDTRVHRPHTAMANLEQYRDPLDPYSTTYKREYTVHHGMPSQLDRPSTARHQLSHELSAPLGVSTYQAEYFKRGRPTRDLPDTTDNHTRNNPHPLSSFMVWRLPHGRRMNTRGNYSDLTDKLLSEIMQGQLASTYQKDYLGIPQGKEGLKSVKLAYGNLADARTDAPYTLNTSTRRTYQMPQVEPELQGNTRRYDCNKQKNLSVNGVVPTVSTRYLNVKSRTTYEREYNTNMNAWTGDNIKKTKEKEALERMMMNYKPHTPTSSHSSSQYRPRPTRCLETPTYSPLNY